MSTFLASSVREAFIFDPIKTTLAAIVLASASQRLYDLDTHTVDYKKARRGTTNDTRGGHEMDRSYWTADLSNKVLGLPQLRQFRVISIDCTLIGDEHDKCVPGLTEKYRDTATYEIGWKLAPWSESERKNSPWIFTKDNYNSQFFLFRLCGESGKLYVRGGYSVTLGPARSDADAVIVELREHKWQDKLTRVVVVELTLYNINLDVISQITLIVEHVETGNILLRAMVLTVEHYWKFNNTAHGKSHVLAFGSYKVETLRYISL
ncbi:hypothetical protein J6590_004600 [Homalodisca vitripennis]|nr:hypothetical protein J6590_004600 [Homalodisca vitripennis]